ncbi:hypothetical protein L1887_34703 [Cichorium endivia]|nr:hypothetical protein L1887_34703 [Cichorium endivia]
MLEATYILAVLDRSSVSLFNGEKPKTASSRWARVGTRAGKNGEQGSQVFANSDAIPAKKDPQDGNETINGIADSGCKVERSALQNGNVVSAIKTCNSDSDSDSSSDSDSDEELIDVLNGESADAIPIKTHVLNNTISLDIHEPESSGMESLPDDGKHAFGYEPESSQIT